MTPFQATLHVSNGAPSGPLSAHFSGQQLVIDGLPAIDVAQLVVSVGGVGAPSLFLNWHDSGGRQQALQPATPDDIARVLASAPAALQPQLQAQWQSRQRNRRQVSNWLLAAGGASVLAAGLLWWQGGNLIGALAGLIPLSTEQQLGRLALAQVRAQGGLASDGAAQQVVEEIGQRLTAGSRYRYRWFVRQDDSVNAFAMPGGVIVVHTGLLRQAASPGELAGVLAHEVQHVEQRHSLRQLIASLGWGALVGVTIGDISAVAAMLAHQAGAMYFSRDMEEQADRLGLQALQRTRIAPDGMLSFFDQLGKQEAGQAGMPGWIASHPQTAARAAQIRSLIDGSPCPACVPLASPRWAAMKAALPAAGK